SSPSTSARTGSKSSTSSPRPIKRTSSSSPGSTHSRSDRRARSRPPASCHQARATFSALESVAHNRRLHTCRLLASTSKCRPVHRIVNGSSDRIWRGAVLLRVSTPVHLRDTVAARALGSVCRLLVLLRCDVQQGASICAHHLG